MLESKFGSPLDSSDSTLNIGICKLSSCNAAEEVLPQSPGQTSLLGEGPKISRFWPQKLSNIPFSISVGAEVVLIGSIKISIRPVDGTLDMNSLVTFWKEVRTGDNVMYQFPYTPREEAIITNCLVRASQDNFCFVAEAHCRLINGRKNASICGCILATSITLVDFETAMETKESYHFPEEWTLTMNLFQPVFHVLKTLFQTNGKALFVNALLVDTNMTQTNVENVSIGMQQTLFGYTMYQAESKGFNLALYIAKDKKEVSSFHTFGFRTIQTFRLDQFNEISLMVWQPPAKVF